MSHPLMNDNTLLERVQAAINAFGEPQKSIASPEKQSVVVVNMRRHLLINQTMEQFIINCYTLLEWVTPSLHIAKGIRVPFASRYRGLTTGEKFELRNKLAESYSHGEIPLFAFDKQQMRWTINFKTYPTLESGFTWWCSYRFDDGTRPQQLRGPEGAKLRRLAKQVQEQRGIHVPTPHRQPQPRHTPSALS